jgi:hypothetical protein
MKSTFIRLMSIMTLATSISAFALPENDKNSSSPTSPSSETTCAPVSRDTQVADPDTERFDNDQEKSRQMKIKEQEKQWLHDVQNIIGG